MFTIGQSGAEEDHGAIEDGETGLQGGHERRPPQRARRLRGVFAAPPAAARPGWRDHRNAHMTPVPGATRRIGLMRNLGPVMERRLAEVGIMTEADLREAGAVAAYVRLCFHAPRPLSRTALHAMEASLRNMDWRDLPKAVKAELDASASMVLRR
jgi:DNA transformation protein